MVSIDGRGGVLCGAFDTGEAFCGSHVLELPYADLNARHTGRAIEVSSSSGTTCILFESGDVACDDFNQRLAFVERPRGLAFQSILVGEGFGCGIDSERYVDCWGNVVQQGGESMLETITSRGTTPTWVRATRTKPFRVRGLAGVSEIRGTSDRLCAIAGADVSCTSITMRSRDEFDDDPFHRRRSCDDRDGSDDRLPGFGTDDPFAPTLGECDDPFFRREASVPSLAAPRAVGISGARALASFGTFGCAVNEDDEVLCFGPPFEPLAPRSYAEAPDESRSERPTLVTELSGASRIELGAGHACALSTSSGPTADARSVVAETNRSPERGGQLWCWGNNESGQLGNAVNAHSSLPVRVQGLEDVDAFAVAGSSTCAIANGELWCWGHRAGMPPLVTPEDDPCRDPKSVCVPHRIAAFKER